MNSVNISGRLTRKPDMRTSGETTIAQFGIACNRRFKNKDGKYDVNFFEVSCFNGLAKFAEKYLDKGIKVEVSGRLQYDKWTDKDGKQNSRISIVANDIEFAESKAAAGNASAKPASAPTPSTADAEFMQIENSLSGEDLPFN